MIKEDYVSFEVAKLLKEKGFDGACNRVYQGPNLKYTTIPISPLMSLGEFGGFHPKQLYVNNNELGDIAYTAPTLQMTCKWLREVHGIFIDIMSRFSMNADKDVCFYYSCKKLGDTYKSCYEYKDGEWLNYEQACEVAIKYCLENLI